MSITIKLLADYREGALAWPAGAIVTMPEIMEHLADELVRTGKAEPYTLPPAAQRQLSEPLSGGCCGG